MKYKKNLLIFSILVGTLFGFVLGVIITKQLSLPVSKLQETQYIGNTILQNSETMTPSKSIINTEAISTLTPIPTASTDLFLCMKTYVDWSAYDSLSLIDIQQDILFWSMSQLENAFFKSETIYIGRKLDNGISQNDIFGDPLFIFEQNKNQYFLPVNSRIIDDLQNVPENTKITLFIKVRVHSIDQQKQMFVEDFIVSDQQNEIPQPHWEIAIRQNGNLYSQETVEIKNQPFTIEIYLPRLALTPSSAMFNIVEKEKMNFDFSENFDLSQNCSPPYLMVPKQPFCYGYGAPRRDRSIVISNWEFVVVGMVDCGQFFSSNVHLDEANIWYETDILYLSKPEADFYPLSEDEKMPLTNFKNQNFVLTTFVDFNKNEIVESGEIKTIELHISE